MNEPSPDSSRKGPLAGLRIIELSGLGPAPYGCMLLADLGADVVTIERPGRTRGGASHIVGRGRTVVEVDLKDAAQMQSLLSLVDGADVLVEAYRPGVMERLGLGPDTLTDRNSRLIYARMTGWGQEGPLAQAAAHDINYIAITGALHAVGTRDHGPVPALNLIGDYAGGGLFMVMGILSALHERHSSGRGQVVDVAITDGVLSLMASTLARTLRGIEHESRESNLFDGGAPFYRCYATSDGKHVSIGALEPQFFAVLAERIGLPEELHTAHEDRSRWPALHRALQNIFAGRNRDEWTQLLDGTDACFAPVLPLSETLAHPHLRARQSFAVIDGVFQPAPAPRFSRTPSQVHNAAPTHPESLDAVKGRWQPR